RVVDQGCRYELRVAEDASQRVLVTEGAVTFADDQREVFVPAGAIARLDQRGVGTPVFLDADPALKKLFDAFDRQRGGDDQRRLQDLVRKIEATAARPADTLPVWHLLAEPDGEVRKVATEILYELAGSPDGGPIGMFTAEQWLAHLRLAAWQVGG
ncbi:MAG: hypothetical protein KAI24_25575, partial [Planctomycetes bacterium]|nr:hypothetical protein [Planctomycetota bacterium]